MIVPTRFGLKYTPIPTLALEYEDDLKGVVDATADNPASLYVYRDSTAPPAPLKKLHVVELPMLTKTSETQQVLRQLQEDNGRFLSSEVVNEAQLKRLLDKLVENLPDVSPTANGQEVQVTPEQATRNADESEFEESFLEESVMEESAVEGSADASRSDDHEARTSPLQTTLESNPNRGTFLSQDASDQEDESRDDVPTKKPDEPDDHEHSEDENDAEEDLVSKQEREQEAEEDAKKTQALRSESDLSEEDVQSEELEYFSEDGSDEDSF